MQQSPALTIRCCIKSYDPWLCPCSWVHYLLMAATPTVHAFTLPHRRVSGPTSADKSGLRCLNWIDMAAQVSSNICLVLNKVDESHGDYTVHFVPEVP